MDYVKDTPARDAQCSWRQSVAPDYLAYQCETDLHTNSERQISVLSANDEKSPEIRPRADQAAQREDIIASSQNNGPGNKHENDARPWQKRRGVSNLRRSAAAAQ